MPTGKVPTSPTAASSRARGRFRSPLSRIGAIARYELRWDLRKAWFYLALALTILAVLIFGAIVPTVIIHLSGSASPTNSSKANSTATNTSSSSTLLNASSYPTWWLFPPYLFSYLLPGFVPLLFGSISSSESFSREREKGTLSALLAQPVSRAEIVLGKFAAKAAEFLLLSTVLVGGVLLLSAEYFGPPQDAAWLPLIVLEVALTFLFFASFALCVSSFTKRPRPVTLLSIVIWLLVLGWMWQSASRGATLVPIVYYVPYSSAMMAIPGAFNFLLHGSAQVSVHLTVLAVLTRFELIHTIYLGQDSGLNYLAGTLIGLLSGIVVFLAIAWLGLSSTDAGGD